MSKIGSIYVEVRGDITKFQKDMSKLRAEGTKASKEVANALNAGISSQRAGKGINDLSTALSKLAQTARIPEKQFAQTANAIAKGLKKEAAAAGVTEKQFAKLNEKMLRTQAYKAAERSMRDIARAAGLSASELKALGVQMGYTAAQSKKMANAVNRTKMKNFTSSLMDTKNTLMGIGIATGVAVYGIKQMTEAIWESGMATKVAENAYKEITGSVAKADAQFRFISATADKLGLNFFTLREGYKGFLAAAQSSKIPMEEVQAIFESVSNAGAILGLSNERMKLSFLALEQMMSKGKVSMEEIRRQLGDNIPGAFQLGAKAMGMTVEAFDKAVSSGTVFADDFLPKFRKALDENFTGTIAESVKAVNKLGEAWEQAKNTMAEGDFMANISKALKEMTDMLKDPGFIDGLTGLTTAMSQLVLVSAKFAAFVGKGESLNQAIKEYARLNQKGLAPDFDFSGTDQLKKVVKYYQNIENLAASASEKIQKNTESVIADISEYAGVSAEEMSAHIKVTEVIIGQLKEKVNSVFSTKWFTGGPSATELAQLDAYNSKLEIARMILTDKRAVEAIDATFKAYWKTANAVSVLKSFESELAKERDKNNRKEFAHLEKMLDLKWEAIDAEDTLRRSSLKADKASIGSYVDSNTLSPYKLDLKRAKDSYEAQKALAVKHGLDLTLIHRAYSNATNKINERENQRAIDANRWVIDAKIAGIKEVERAAAAETQAEIEADNAVIAKEKELYEKKLEKKAEFDQQYAEMSMTNFDIERAAVEQHNLELMKLYEDDAKKQLEVAELTADKLKKITQAEQDAKLAIYQGIAGGISQTFQMIADAGGEQSRLAFAAFKAFAMIEGVISAHRIFLKAMDDPSNPTIVGSMTAAHLAFGMSMLRVGMIAAAQPPSYDSGGISSAKGVYQTGNIREAHIPIPSGKVPVEIKGNDNKPTEITIMNAVDPGMMDSYLASSRGQDAIVNILSNRSQSIRRVLR